MNIVYQSIVPEVELIIDLFNHSAYFPISDKSDVMRIKNMFDRANLVISAWDNDRLVGICRALTDFCYCCYLSDLAVRDGYKKKGMGRRLVVLTKEKAGEQCKLILHSSPDAIDFYSAIGMERIDTAFIIKRSY